ncbi:tRNA lysidine(34) synthetase TilS [Rhizobium sp. TRM95111]|uniref:tRNA lysidine(34) synthetase TilS n=1 Tax=Rhizobium alarense TaxID=2846851 RepID=UPI001F431C99|nr:tRNA lysidine(34) synthetase TilS [Rhizobium alarense]MCF3638384.1 tRNA lysidine(34) synthetase TilS [Rhizobium alarense]
MTGNAPPSDRLLSALADFLTHFRRPARLLVAVSGGSDSTGLLVGLNDVLARAGRRDISLAACTVDHSLRAGSAAEADLVAALCHRLRIPHRTLRWEGPRPASGLQEAAREARYDLLAAAARVEAADAILVAHTADDQRETIAMRSVRRAAGAGLSGIAPATLFDSRHWILRPLLAVDRAAIRRYLAQQGVGWIDDPSNENPRFERVRMRQSGGGLPPVRTSDQAWRQDLARRAAGFIADHVRMPAPDVGAIDRQGLAVLGSDPAHWRALLYLVAVLGGRRHPPGAEAAARLSAFLGRGILSRTTAGRVVFDRRRDGLYLYREARGLPADLVPPKGRLVWDGRYTIVNDLAVVLTVRAGNPGMAGDGNAVPDGVLKRAVRALPEIEGTEDLAGGAISRIRALAPFDRFLPVFDLEMANALATLVGRERFPPPPTNDDAGPGVVL